METGIFAAGCFWKPDLEFEELEGVKKTEVGYCGGKDSNTTYENVCTGKTNHAEVVKVFLDESIITYGELIKFFLKIHDPTTLNRQGPDIGTQYRSAIFFHNEDQKKKAELSKSSKQSEGTYPDGIVTEITPHETFYRAEEYHQIYFEKMGRH